MNVFEDLIEELRDENLLEQTVIDLRTSTPVKGNKRDLTGQSLAVPSAAEPVGNDAHAAHPESGFDIPESDRDFYGKRAMDEVSSLQMVEHIFSGIEREHMKMVPAAYDDLEAKKALHRFLQVQAGATTTDYADAEFNLMHETESWSSALSDRDQRISVSNLRRFCENSRPVLSSQALMALGRFYRNASYSELGRAKFDLVMTRLFSREADDEKRRLLFSRAEMIGHIKTLYASWSSVALYSTDEASLRTRAVVAGFDDRLQEAESAQTFEELIQNGFFNKVHEFKEGTGEMFFTPEIVAATIDCNVRIGNKFVDLIQFEREKTNSGSVEQRYGYEYDQIISDAAGKTFHLVELLKGVPGGASDESEPAQPEFQPAASARKSEGQGRFTVEMFGVNKWLLLTTILVVIGSAVFYFWPSKPAAEATFTDQANNVSLDSTDLKDYLRSGRATSETLYAIALPAWDQVPEEKQKEILQRALDFANNNGQKNVQVVNVSGRNLAFASKARVEILKVAP